MNIEMIKNPTIEDWTFCKVCTLNTVGKKIVNAPTDKWKVQLLESEHSPIRTLWFAFKMEIPYWVSVHFVRHKFGVEHFVQSQRNDRQGKYDRTSAPQGELVSHVMYLNATELINMAHVRLCHQASLETRQVMEEIVRLVLTTNPEFESVLVPRCFYRGGVCTEFTPCGLNKTYKKGNDNEK